LYPKDVSNPNITKIQLKPHLNRSAGILKSQACEEKEVPVRQADLELEGLDQIKDGGPCDEESVAVLGERAVGEVANAGNLLTNCNVIFVTFVSILSAMVIC